MPVLGLDTSNYTTSAAVFDGAEGRNESRLLTVKAGELGLRQSEALFQHVQRLPGQLEKLAGAGLLKDIRAVGASTRPREVEGSYMPCFLAGMSQGQSMASLLGVPFFAVSHQQGHLAAAAWSAGRMELLDSPFLAWHLSGGTTELLLVRPEGVNVQAEILGGTSDISAGQLIDRTGVLLGLPFPAGKALDELYVSGHTCGTYHVKLNGYTFSLSGMENKVRQLLDRGAPAEEIAGFVQDLVADIVLRTTQAAMKEHPGLPVLCSGGVASNRRLRRALVECGALFARPEHSKDNAMGVAILTHRLMEERGA